MKNGADELRCFGEVPLRSSFAETAKLKISDDGSLYTNTHELVPIC
jgi:hypothetical protein